MTTRLRPTTTRPDTRRVCTVCGAPLATHPPGHALCLPCWHWCRVGAQVRTFKRFMEHRP